MTQQALFLLAVIIIAVLRLSGVTHVAYQAMAHVLVGAVGALAFCTEWTDTTEANGVWAGYFWMFWGLCAVEIFAVIVGLLASH